MTFDFAYALEILPLLLRAAIVTVQATVLGFALALVVGLVIAILRRSRWALVSRPVGFFNEFVRTTPLLVQLYFLYFVLPNYGLSLSALETGVLALGLHYGAYLSEVYRAGLESVPRGQWEACISLDLSPWQTYRHIVLPQAVPPVIPALGNYLIAMFKETPLLSAITVIEMLLRAKLIASESFRYMEPVTLVGLIFLVMSLVSAALIRLAERRFGLVRFGGGRIAAR